MDFSYSPKVVDLQKRLTAFMEEHIYPAEAVYHHEVAENRKAGNPWQPTKVMEELKAQAKAAGLWNLFLPESKYGAGLTNLEYAPLCEIMGRSHVAPEAFNCSAPDTGNMETLVRYATEEQQQRWLLPLLDGTIRSAFAMTEPAVASSDATNIEARVERDGDEYVINGRKWWTSGAPDPRCEILIFMGQTDPSNPDAHKRQSMILVPMKTPGVKMERALSVFGYDHAPHGHGEVSFDNVRVTVFEGTDFAAEAWRVSKPPVIDGNLDDWNLKCPIPLIGRNQLQVLNNRMALAMTWLTILGTAVLVPNTLATIGGLLPLEGSSLTWFLYVILFSTLASTALAWWWVSKKIYLPTRADEFVPVNERRHRKR